MKPIELTKQQQDNLLIMCSTLFPEYKKIYWNSGKESNGSSEHIGFGTCNKTNDCVDFIYIHWFELCMTYLPVEMYKYAMHKCNLKPKKALEIIENNLHAFVDFNRYYINPIDYLYEEFLKLK